MPRSGSLPRRSTTLPGAPVDARRLSGLAAPPVAWWNVSEIPLISRRPSAPLAVLLLLAIAPGYCFVVAPCEERR